MTTRAHTAGAATAHAVPPGARWALAVAGAVAFAASLERSAWAPPPWGDPDITLLGGDCAVDVRLGLGHVPAPDDTGAGGNAEVGLAITRPLQLSVRTR